MFISQKVKRRIIFHLDMNCFYAAVEVAINPKLKGKPIAIAGNPKERKGIIVTSSYEARDKGVRTTMPLWEARKLCPDLIVLPPNFEKYREASKLMFQILAEITPLVEPVSIDEGYMDVTEATKTVNAIALAKKIQSRIMNELKLPCSIGIAPNKFLAKMASDMKKPLGITVLRKRELSKMLWPLKVTKMHGVGEKTAEKLAKINIHTIQDLAEHNVYELTQLLGINGQRLKDRANGIDIREVNPESVHERKSIGNSRTLPIDVHDEVTIQNYIKSLSENVEQRLKRRNMLGITVQLMIRYSDWNTITRSKKMLNYTDDAKIINAISCELFQQHWNGNPIRLIGVTVQDIDEKTNVAKQLDLFTFEQEMKQLELHSTVTEINKRYGKEAISYLVNKKATEKKANFTTSFQKDYLDDYLKS